MFFLCLILGLFGVEARSTPNAIETADKHHKVNPWIYEDKVPGYMIVDLNAQSSLLWNKNSGFDVFINWQFRTMGLAIGHTESNNLWSTIGTTPYLASSYDDVTTEMSPESEPLLARSATEEFRFSVNHIGVNFSSPLFRGNDRALMQLKGTWFFGLAQDTDYKKIYSAKGVSLTTSVAFPMASHSNFFWNLGYSLQFTVMEAPGLLSRKERSLYAELSHFLGGIALVF